VNDFYCVKCGRLLRIEQARALFKTGYFRVEYRLGCCMSCFPDPDRTVFEAAAVSAVSS